MLNEATHPNASNVNIFWMIFYTIINYFKKLKSMAVNEIK